MLITVDADIDDNGPFLDPVSADQLWTADGSDADIRLITTSEVEISLLVTEADYDTVLEAIEEAVNA